MNSSTPSSPPGRTTRASSLQRAIEVGDVAQAERDGRGLEAPVRKRQREGVGVEHDGFAARCSGAAGRSPVASGFGGLSGVELRSGERQHRQAEVGGDDLDPRAAQRQGLVAGAAAEVEDAGSRRAERATRASRRRQTRSSEAESRWFSRS